MPSVDVMLTILPAPFAFITGATALAMKKLPLRLMSIWASQSSSVVSSMDSGW